MTTRIDEINSSGTITRAKGVFDSGDDFLLWLGVTSIQLTVCVGNLEKEQHILLEIMRPVYGTQDHILPARISRQFFIPLVDMLHELLNQKGE